MAGIEKVQRRLRQSRFFYEHLVNPRTSTKGNPEAFRFYFSAFIQTARTITWTIKTEEKKKWQEWEPKWRAERSGEEQKLLDLTNELRILEEKRGGADLTTELEEVAVEALVEAVPPDRRLHTAFLQAQRRRLPGASTKIKVVLPSLLRAREGKAGGKRLMSAIPRIAGESGQGLL